MRRFLLDTGVAADYIFRRRGIYERGRQEVAQGNILGIGLPILGELFAGVEYSATRERNRRRLVQELADLSEWPFDHAAAEEFGRLFALLRQMGRPMQQIDIQTAAIVRVLPRCTLVSHDSDFTAIPGLPLENW